MEFIQIYAKATEVVKAKDALKLIEELKAAGAKLTVEQYEVAIEAIAGVFDKIEVENDFRMLAAEFLSIFHSALSKVAEDCAVSVVACAL